MRLIPVHSYPPKRTYSCFEAAIAGAQNHPLQPKAQADTASLAGTTIVDSYWTDTDFVVIFTNKQFLHVWVAGDEVQWEVTQSPWGAGCPVERIGSPAVTLRWRPPVGDSVMDRSALAAKRRGKAFRQLFVNEGLWLYCHEQPIWYFQAIRRTDTDEPMLFVTDED